MTHLDSDVLAEFRAGLITGRRGVKIAAHLAGCARCTALDDQLAGVSALLASVPAPPMPDRVAQRLDTVLAAEVARKNYPERSEVASPGGSGAHARPAARRGFRLPAWRVLVPVGAAVVLLAGGGYGLSQLIGQGSPQTFSAAAGSAASSSSAGSAAKGLSRAAPPEAAPSSPAASARPQLKSGHQPVDVSSLTLRQHVEAELLLARASRPTKAASSQVLGCIHLLAASAPLELVESVRFEGHPATIVVARTGQDDTAWVAGPACSATSRDVLDTITLP
jgi:hypothetical protein